MRKTKCGKNPKKIVFTCVVIRSNFSLLIFELCAIVFFLRFIIKGKQTFENFPVRKIKREFNQRLNCLILERNSKWDPSRAALIV